MFTWFEIIKRRKEKKKVRNIIYTGTPCVTWEWTGGLHLCGRAGVVPGAWRGTKGGLAFPWGQENPLVVGGEGSGGTLVGVAGMLLQG